MSTLACGFPILLQLSWSVFPLNAKSKRVIEWKVIEYKKLNWMKKIVEYFNVQEDISSYCEFCSITK